MQTPSPRPLPPSALADPPFEQWPREENRGQEHAFENLERVDRPPA